MGKAAKSVVAVVAAIAIPFVAGPIAASIGLSSAIGGALGSATAGSIIGGGIAGAGLGALTAAATGTNIGKGAMFGGLGGGIGGWAQGSATIEGIAGATTDQVGALAALQGAPIDATYASQIGLTQALENAGATATITSLGDGTVMYSPPTFVGTTTPVGYASESMQRAQAAQTAVPQTGEVGQGAQAAQTGQGAQVGQTTSFGDALSKVPSEIASKFSDPKTLADLVLRAGSQLLTGMAADDGLTPEEQALLDAQTADLNRLRQQDERLFKLKLNEAMGLLGEARYFDPNQFGIEAANRMRVSSAAQEREIARSAGLRPGSPNYSAADQRRASLDTTARAQTAYLQGHESAQRQKLATHQAGLAALPTGGMTQALQYGQGVATQYAEADRRRRQNQFDIGSFLGDISGGKQSEDDRRKAGLIS